MDHRGDKEHFRVSGNASVTCDPHSAGKGGSPIVLDLLNRGFHFVSEVPGVMFDIDGSGKKEQIAWTDAAYGNGFLALPDSHGWILSGKQLFGNYTPQLPCPPDQPRCQNGFRALAALVGHEGAVTPNDPVWSRLRIWVDSNGNGKVDDGELLTLEQIGLQAINLAYMRANQPADHAILRWKGSVIGMMDPVIYDVVFPVHEQR